MGFQHQLTFAQNQWCTNWIVNWMLPMLFTIFDPLMKCASSGHAFWPKCVLEALHWRGPPRGVTPHRLTRPASPRYFFDPSGGPGASHLWLLAPCFGQGPTVRNLDFRWKQGWCAGDMLLAQPISATHATTDHQDFIMSSAGLILS